MSGKVMKSLHCVCCGRPFARTSPRGPAPLYCSRDCRRQMDVRRRAWSDEDLFARPALAEPAGSSLPF